MDLLRFLKPKSFAIVGASEKEGFGGGTCRNNLTYSKDLDRVYFVNPSRSEVFGRACYKSLLDVPGQLDAVVIATPKATVLEIMRQAKTKGAAGVVVYAAGYGEVCTPEAEADELELKNLALELDLAIMGPNCAGFINYVDGKFLYSILHPERDRKGKVGFVSQSGQILMSLLDSPNMTFSYCFSCGNAKVVSPEEYLSFLVDDEDTAVAAMYLEGTGNPALLEDCFHRAALKRKPVVALKVGKSERAMAIARSHTGSLTGSDAIFDALFKKYGVIRVSDMQELLSVSLALAEIRCLPQGDRVAIICLSGGETAICADEGHKIGIKFPDFEKATVEKLRKLLPFYAAPDRNPLDITATPAYQPEVLSQTLQAVLNDPNVDMVLLGFTLMEEIVDNAFYVMFEGIAMALELTEKPFACLNFIEMTRNAGLTKRFADYGVPMLPCTKYAFEVLRHILDFAVFDYGRKRRMVIGEPIEAMGPVKPAKSGMAGPGKTSESIEPSGPREPVAFMPPTGTRVTLSELESKALLAEYGIQVGQGVLAKSVKEAVAAAQTIGYPVVLKIESAEIAHKSDVGGVKLNLANDREVEKAFAEIMDSVAQNAPKAAHNGV
ncbi:MAG: acetate--CoA ligase family protein, partial [Deltaproteobacteria bacterium]|nr:acetate--CoA ligase family protein [Deltaproteobacteria bacterium]